MTTLREWALQYLQNRDLLMRAITGIQKNTDGWDIVLTTTTESRYVTVLPDLGAITGILEKASGKNVLVVTTNVRTNVDAVIAAWPELIKHPKLSILFVNPYSGTDKRWTINPHVHEKVTERKALKLGLYSLFSTVEEYAG